MSFIACLKSLIKRGKTTTNGHDSGVVQTCQVQYMNKTTTFDTVNPAGFSHNPTVGKLVVLFNVGAVEDNICGIVTDQLDRIKNLVPGETIIYNTVTKSSILLAADGSIQITGNVTINGDLNVTGKTNLGVGGPAIARVGDSVMVGVNTGFITSGSTNNTAN